jgi:hypothetical protein
MENDTLEIDINGLLLSVKRHDIGKLHVYRIEFSDQRPPLVVHQALDARSKPFWTSIPQGRQTEAVFFGERIEEKLNS